MSSPGIGPHGLSRAIIIIVESLAAPPSPHIFTISSALAKPGTHVLNVPETQASHICQVLGTQICQRLSMEEPACLTNFMKPGLTHCRMVSFLPTLGVKYL